MVRRVLWEAGAPIAWREHMASLVRHHQALFWAMERPDLRKIVFRVSLSARNDDLALPATADILGRRCGDTAEVSVGLAATYRARVEITALEAPPRVLRDRMARRSSPVPTAAMERLVRRWETPDPTEAHRVAHESTA